MTAPYWVLKSEFDRYWTDRGKPSYGWTDDRRQRHHYETLDAARVEAARLPAWAPRIFRVTRKPKPPPDITAVIGAAVDAARHVALCNAERICLDVQASALTGGGPNGVIGAYERAHGARRCADLIAELRGGVK